MISEHITKPRFKEVFCSQCGGEFPGGDSGFSSCDRHEGKVDRSRVDAAMAALKINDPHGQRRADKTMVREIEMRAVTGGVL